MHEPQQTVLILNGSHAEIPLIQAAKSLGYRIVTTGADPMGLGHPYADAYIPADFSDAGAVLRVARDEDVVGVIAGCNDFAAITAAHVADTLDFPGHDRPDTCVRLHHKDKFRGLMDGLGLPSIRSVRISEARDARNALASLSMPVIVKPIDLTGGKGMTICETMDHVTTAIETALSRSRANHVVIEEYQEGSHHGFTCLIQAGKVAWWFADDEQYFLNPFLVAGTSAPSSLDTNQVDELIQAVEVISQELNLVDGLVHTQCVVTQHGPRVIEMCRRCPGDLYPEFVRLSTGLEYAENVVRTELGLPPVLPSVWGSPTPTVRNCVMAETEGLFEEVVISPAIEDAVLERWPLVEAGTPVTDHLTQKQEIVLLQFSSEEQMQAHLARRNSDVRVIMQRSVQ